jgi:aspartyl-tRNA(Asn)/glutamyl-tRNA(Gln) amidotransferase subunit A
MQSIIRQINGDILNKRKSIKEIVDSYLLSINSHEDKIGSLLELYDNDYIHAAIKKSESMFEDGTHTLLTGVPIVIKDNICNKGRIASAGSKMLSNYKSTYNATVVDKLLKAGAIIVGRSNMDEFAMGSSTENSAYKMTYNPLNTDHVPGGSSGGSAAVVSYGGVPISLGSDTGGSVRQPAAFTGVVGLKPTYGSVSRYGLIAMGSSLDVVGPFANYVEDTKILFDIIKGPDGKDATATSETMNASNFKQNRKIIGVPYSFINQEGVSPQVRDNFNLTIDKLKEKGYTVRDITIPNIEKALSVYYILMFAEVSSNLARYDGVRYGKSVKGQNPNESMVLSRTQGLGPEPLRRSLLGTYILSSGYYDAYYYKAIQARDQLKNEFAKILTEVDYIATPTSPILAWKPGEKSDPLSMYLADIFTVPANIIGVPGISIPTGQAENNLKHSIQFLTYWNNEEKLFTIGYELE